MKKTKFSYESDGKMGKNNGDKPQKKTPKKGHMFFNTTQDSE